MSDKNLTELEWKKFSKGKGYKDAAFVKALAALETGKTPEAKLAALDDIEKQADVLRKAAKADKELASYLDDADKAAAKERKQQEAEAKKAKQSASTDDEEDSPALLTTKMIPLMRTVPKGETLNAMVALTGKEVAVLVSKKPIGPPRRKLLTDYLGVSGGVKFAAGEVIWEAKSHTFVLQTQAAGLAKKIKAALYKQTEQRFKVRVRGEDPNDIDDDGELPEDEAAEGEANEGTTATAATETTTATTAPVQSDEGAAFNTRLAALMPKVKEAIVAAGPSATDIKLKVSEAGLAARKHEFVQANALLDEAERMMASAPVASGSTQQPVEAPKPPAAGPSFVNMQKSRLAWQQTRQAVKAELAKLEASILDKLKDHSDFAGVQRGVRRLDEVLTVLDDELVDTLDRALNAQDPAERNSLNAQAREQVQAYRDYVATDGFVADLDTNPFTPIKIRDTVTRSLAVLDKALA